MTNQFTLHHGDCLDVLRGMADNSVHAVVCDPPYGLSQHTPEQVSACLTAWLAGEVYAPKGKGFMGKSWDAWVPGPEVWREALRVLKPGGHVLAFAGTRSMDLMSMAIRLAGFELRDAVGYAHDGGGAPLMAYCYGSGFPKSMDVSKQLDKMAGVEREVLGTVDPRGTFDGRERNSAAINTKWRGAEGRDDVRDLSKKDITAPATESARQWQGWGTALKPAWEPIILARKPLIGTVAENVLAHGTGALNIDGCRVASQQGENFARPVNHTGLHEGWDRPWKHDPNALKREREKRDEMERKAQELGRWPANLIHDGSDEVVGLFPQTASGAHSGNYQRTTSKTKNAFGERAAIAETRAGDKGSAARFFYCAKASKRDRDEGLEGFEVKRTGGMQATDDGSMLKGSGNERTTARANIHPTVKPTDLMRYLCRLVTPPGGVVLDPFMGSGSTGKAAMLEGFDFIGIEREAQYLAIARARIEHEAAKVAQAAAAAGQPAAPQLDLFSAA